jgi:DNA-binding MarR family transcriptional regulator
MRTTVEEHPEVQVFDEISLIEHGVRTVVGGCLPVGLTYPQFEVMNLVMRRGGELAPTEIAEALKMTPGAITNTLQRLEVLGLVEIAPCGADRRRKRVRLTASGREAYNRAMAAIRPKMEKLRDGFTSQEFRDVLPFLRALRVWMSENA